MSPSVFLRGIPVLATLCVLAGCTTLGIGHGDYGCQATPDHPICLSASRVYAATEHTDHVVDTPSGGRSAEDPSTAAARPSRDGPRTRVASATAHAEPPASSGPAADATAPLRVPSQVMRIWIAPWEDAAGDLNGAAYVYTEIEPRRWLIGQRPAPLARNFAPLQIDPAPPEIATPDPVAPIAPPARGAAAVPAFIPVPATTRQGELP
ncbi:MAG: type IV conjugative transfer system lipoprotein TraV [Gammaproteobacteria bacterium]